MDRPGQPGLAERAADGFFLVSPVPRRRHPRGDGLGLGAGPKPTAGGQRVSFAAEQSVLTVLLQARCPVVAVLARPVAGARLPPDWADPLAQGRMAVVSAAIRAGRLTEELAAERSQWVAQLARQIVVAHASPGGRLSALRGRWCVEGRPVIALG